MIEEKIISSAMLLTTCQGLKDAYPFLTFITAIDYPVKNAIEMVYHLQSLNDNNTLMLKVALPREKPTIPSVTAIWPAADWHEREVFDLFGVNFLNHPNLRRILLTEDWKGHPLLKDYTDPAMKKKPETIK